MGSCWSGSTSSSAGSGEREPLVKKTASARLYAETLFGRLAADENGDVRVRDVMRELRRDRAAAATALGLPVEVARGGKGGEKRRRVWTNLPGFRVRRHMIYHVVMTRYFA